MVMSPLEILLEFQSFVFICKKASFFVSDNVPESVYVSQQNCNKKM